MSVTPAAPMLRVSDSLQLHVVASSNGTIPVPAPTGSWSSSDVAIAKVSSNGLLYGTGEGVATVTFRCSSCPWIDVPVTVTPRLSSLTMRPTNATVNSGSSFQFTATGVVDGADRDVSGVASWSLDNTLQGAASIDAGLLTIDNGAVSTQTVIVVTASYAGLKTSTPVFVNP